MALIRAASASFNPVLIVEVRFWKTPVKKSPISPSRPSELPESVGVSAELKTIRPSPSCEVLN